MKLTKQENRLFEMLSRGGCYSVADITRELGMCDPRGHISRMRRKGVNIANERIRKADGVNYNLYWLEFDKNPQRVCNVMCRNMVQQPETEERSGEVNLMRELFNPEK